MRFSTLVGGKKFSAMAFRLFLQELGDSAADNIDDEAMKRVKAAYDIGGGQIKEYFK